jgi:hypothetical protein
VRACLDSLCDQCRSLSNVVNAGFVVMYCGQFFIPSHSTSMKAYWTHSQSSTRPTRMPTNSLLRRFANVFVRLMITRIFRSRICMKMATLSLYMTMTYFCYRPCCANVCLTLSAGFSSILLSPQLSSTVCSPYDNICFKYVHAFNASVSSVSAHWRKLFIFSLYCPSTLMTGNTRS